MQVFAIWSHIAATSIEIEADIHFHPYIIHLDISSSRPKIGAQREYLKSGFWISVKSSKACELVLITVPSA
jgi:hypothetical protein